MAQLKAEEIRHQERSLEKRRMKELKKEIQDNSDSDEIFYYIAGYTSNGVPYGITWEEIEEETEEEM